MSKELFYSAIFLLVVSVVLFIYDYIMDIRDSLKGIGTMVDGKYAEGYVDKKGLTKNNAIRSVAKYVLLILSSVLLVFSQKRKFGNSLDF